MLDENFIGIYDKIKFKEERDETVGFLAGIRKIRNNYPTSNM